MDLANPSVCRGQLIIMGVFLSVGLDVENESTDFQSNGTMPWTFGGGAQQTST
jgi:hypothetical protein